MFTKIRKSLAAMALVLGLVAVPLLAFPATGHAQQGSTEVNLADKLKCGTNLSIDDPTNCNATTQGSSTKFNDIVRDIINIFSIIVGIIAVVMIVYAGARFIMSGGDPGKTADARNTIIYALVGLVVVAIAQFVSQFVLEKVSNTVSGS